MSEKIFVFRKFIYLNKIFNKNAGEILRRFLMFYFAVQTVN